MLGQFAGIVVLLGPRGWLPCYAVTSRPLASSATLVAIGDIHRCWREVDAVYLERSQPDLAMFVGDLGDEDVEMVRRIADLSVNKAVILGNHDAWQSFAKKEVTEKLN